MTLMSGNDRRDPDELLASIQDEDSRKGRGRLKIFLGMCPGVGKTFAMLEAGQALRRKGQRVVVAWVETHGREETRALLEGLEILPRRKVEYRGSLLEEMDLEAALACRGAVLLVDEFAHSNAPESRHAKRYQDVLALREAGLTVYSTLNIQHIESRVDVLRQITGIRVQEKVPDSVFDSADEVELVDLTPGQLRQRLAEGKVYLGERGAVAAENFFKEENLTALREMALRYTADKVDQELGQFMKSRRIRGWRTRERLLVAVGPSPYAESLLRWTRRQAGMMDSPWTALYVDTGAVLPEPVKERVSRALALAQKLGAEVKTCRGENVGETILRFARDHRVTQIVLGKSEEASWKGFCGLNFAERLIRSSGEIDVLVVRPDKSRRVETEVRPRALRAAVPVADWVWSGGIFAGITALCWVLVPAVGYFSVALIYLFCLVLASLKLNRGPVLVLALSSALAWDFFFIPPQFTLHIGEAQDVLMFAMMLLVALVTGHLTARLREREGIERERERRTATLLAFTETLAKTPDLAGGLSNALGMIMDLFPVKASIFRRLTAEALSAVPEPGSTFFPDAKEHSVAAWTYQEGRAAGRFTETLGHARALYLPLLTQVMRSGVLAVEPEEGRHLDLADRALLENFCVQLAFALEKDHVLAAMQKAELSERSSELQKTLLDSVSHELKTPLAVLQSATEILEKEKQGASLTGEIRLATARLHRVVNHLLEITRIETGVVRPQSEWCDLGEIGEMLAQHFRQEFPGRQLEIRPGPAELFLVDGVLLEKALWNVLHNAALYTPREKKVELDFRREGPVLQARVRDHGPGLSEEERGRIFEKFFRGPSGKTGGTGLGLPISRGFVRAMDGSIEVLPADGGGSVFTICLPGQWRQADSLPGL